MYICISIYTVGITYINNEILYVIVEQICRINNDHDENHGFQFFGRARCQVGALQFALRRPATGGDGTREAPWGGARGNGVGAMGDWSVGAWPTQELDSYDFL